MDVTDQGVSGQDATVDLSPRTTTDPGAPQAPSGRRWLWVAGLAALLAVAAFIIFQFLSNATLYFCNADEVGRRDACSEGDRFRLQGTVDDGSVQLAERDVIEEKQRTSSLHEDVVRAVVHETMPNRVVAPGLDGDLDFRPDAIGTRHQQRIR